MTEHELFNVFIGLAVVTVLAAGGALVGWYYCLSTYREYMSDRAYSTMKFVVPPFVVLSASPVADVALWLLTDEFPTVGAVGPTLGLLGATVALVYVLFDVRKDMNLEEEAAAGGETASGDPGSVAPPDRSNGDAPSGAAPREDPHDPGPAGEEGDGETGDVGRSD